MRIFNFLLAIVFLVFAFIKTNAPDPILWILLYGAMSVICILAMFDVYLKWLIFLMFIPVIHYAVSFQMLTRDWIHSGGADRLHIEEVKDFFRLMLCFFVLVFYGFRSFRKA